MKNNVITSLKADFTQIQQKVEIFFPISDIIKPRDWRKIKIRYINKWSNQLDCNKEEVTNVCFLDEFIDSFHDDSNAYIDTINAAKMQMLNALEYVNSTKYKHLTKNIHNIIRDIFVSIDDDPITNNKDYRNHIAELYVFNYFMDCENCIVNSIESPLKNGKSIDFEITCHDENILIEVFSIQNIDVSLHDAKTVADFISDKIDKKYNSKTDGIDIDNLYILPVIDYDEELVKMNIQIHNPKLMMLMMTMVNRVEGANKGILQPYAELVKPANE